jgi:hypothetical protein
MSRLFDPAHRTPRRSYAWAARLLPLLLGLAAATARADKTDVALFKNGDRLTGEIKALDRGKISFDTDAAGVIKLEWDDIEQLYSSATFEVTLTTGETLYGTLGDTKTEGEVRIQTDTETRNLPTLTVVRMTPIKAKVLDRIDMSVDLGYSLAKANDLNQTTFGYDFGYRDETRQLTLNVDSSVSSSSSEPASTRVFTNLTYRRFLDKGEWDPFAIGQVERNDELAIDRRTSIGGGMGRWLRDTNSSRIAFGGGLIRSAEDDFGSSETKTDSEALVAFDLEWFRYDEPELDVSMQFTGYKRLSGSKEPRGNVDLNLRWELFKDFFWGLSVYYTYDRQAEVEEEKADYGVFTSFGWKL